MATSHRVEWEQTKEVDVEVDVELQVCCDNCGEAMPIISAECDGESFEVSVRTCGCSAIDPDEMKQQLLAVRRAVLSFADDLAAFYTEQTERINEAKRTIDSALENV